MSGVSVEQMMRPMSAGCKPAVSIALRPASMPSVAEVSSASQIRRSRIPVRVTIHSSEV